MNNRIKELAQQMRLVSNHLSKDGLTKEEIYKLEQIAADINEEISKKSYDTELFNKYLNGDTIVKVPSWFNKD